MMVPLFSSTCSKTVYWPARVGTPRERKRYLRGIQADLERMVEKEREVMKVCDWLVVVGCVYEWMACDPFVRGWV